MGLLTITLARAKTNFCSRYKDRFNCQLNRDGNFVHSMATRLWEECQHGLDLADRERTKAAAEVAYNLLELLPKDGQVSMNEVRAALSLAVTKTGPLE